MKIFKKAKEAATKTLRRKVISTIIAAIASILLLYGVDLPKDLQDSITTVTVDIVNFAEEALSQQQ